MATIKQMSNTRSWEGVEQRAHSDIDCEGVKWYIRFGKLALMKLNIHLTKWPNSSIPRYLFKKKENVPTKKVCMRMFIAALY